MDILDVPLFGQTLQDILNGATRFARPIITYNGTGVSQQVYPSLQELVYKEGTEQTGDNVELKLADPEGLFRLTWSLKAAVPLNLALESENWNFLGERTYRDCGSFQISRIGISQSKRAGTIVALNASSIPISSSGRLERKNRAWSKTTLKAMAAQIAADNGLALQYIAKENPSIARSDQHDESDFVLLNRHAHENDLFVKVKSGTLWIISKEELEHQSPVGTIVCSTPDHPGGINGTGGFEHWEINESTEDIYKAAEVKFRHPKTGATLVGTCTDPNAVVGPTLRDHYYPHPEDTEDTDNSEMPIPKASSATGLLPPLISQVWAYNPYPQTVPAVDSNTASTTKAGRVAKSKLKKKNRKGKKHRITVPLNLRVEAGTVYTLQGFSPDFDANWLVTECEHKFSAKGGSTTSLDLQMCILGY